MPSSSSSFERVALLGPIHRDAGDVRRDLVLHRAEPCHGTSWRRTAKLPRPAPAGATGRRPGQDVGHDVGLGVGVVLHVPSIGGPRARAWCARRGPGRRRRHAGGRGTAASAVDLRAPDAEHVHLVRGVGLRGGSGARTTPAHGCAGCSRSPPAPARSAASSALSGTVSTMSMNGLAARPGTDVEPTWSTARALGSQRVADAPRLLVEPRPPTPGRARRGGWCRRAACAPRRCCVPCPRRSGRPRERG